MDDGYFVMCILQKSATIKLSLPIRVKLLINDCLSKQMVGYGHTSRDVLAYIRDYDGF